MTRPAIRLPTLEASSFGSGASILVNQDAHGFSVGDPVYFDGTDWALAQADVAAHLHIGVVSEVTDAANCTVALAGEITGLSGLTSGTWYYLDQDTPGAVTSTEPTTGIKASVYQATSATTAAVVPYIPQKSSETSSTVVDVSLTDSDLTAVAGKHYRIDPSGITADRNFILPAGTDLQEVSFELIDNAPADYELIIKGDTGVSGRLRSNDAVTANEITRCFIRGESMRWVHDGTDWVCNGRDDGRIPLSAKIKLTSAASGEAAQTKVKPTDQSGAWTAEYDNANASDVTEDRIYFRRDCSAQVFAGFGTNFNEFASVTVARNGNSTTASDYIVLWQGATADGNMRLSGSGTAGFDAGDFVEFYYLTNGGNHGLDTVLTYLSVIEILQ